MIKPQSMQLCTGCAACQNICPTNAIQMEPNEEGFLFPVIDENKCMKCSKCDEVCQLNQQYKCRNTGLPLVYAAIHENRDILMSSSSGGVFSALADYVACFDGVVVGCQFDDTMIASHCALDAKYGYSQFRGSKYVQSNIGYVYRQTEEYLKRGRFVLFSGTPCQVHGLKLYLGKRYDKLITADLICHGVPSPELWARHVNFLERRANKRIISYRFREKRRKGSSLYHFCYYYEGSTRPRHGIAILDPYYSAFSKGENLRECCYQCKYADLHRVGDFTLGDYWGCEKYHRDLCSKDGISLLLVNNERAKDILHNLEKSLKLIPTKMEWVLQKNRNLSSPTTRPASRDMFYKNAMPNLEKWERDFTRSLSWFILKVKSAIPYKLKDRIKEILKFLRPC